MYSHFENGSSILRQQNEDRFFGQHYFLFTSTWLFFLIKSCFQLLLVAVLVLFLWILNSKMKLIQVMNCLYKCRNFCLSLKDLDVRCFLFVPLQWLHFSKWGERLFQKPKLRQTETSMRLWNYGAALLYVHLHSKRLQKLNIVKQWLGASST